MEVSPLRSIKQEQSSSDSSMNMKQKRIYRKHNMQKIKRWTKEESLLYNRFIAEHSSLLSDPSIKRAKKIFILMSNYIKTKNPSQCRSHHQKFYRKENSEDFSLTNQTENLNSEGTNEKNDHFFFQQKLQMGKPFVLQMREPPNFGRKELKPALKLKFREECKKNCGLDDEEIKNVNKLTKKELDDFICSAKMLFDVGTQMQKLRKNFEEFEKNHLQIFKESCKFFQNFVFLKYIYIYTLK